MLVLAGAQVKPAGRAANFNSLLAGCAAVKMVVTYALGLACSDVVWQPITVVWVTHEDGGFDSSQCVASQSSSGAAAECVVHDLATLSQVSRRCMRARC